MSKFENVVQIDKAQSSKGSDRNDLIPTLCGHGTCAADHCVALAGLSVTKEYKAGETVFWDGDASKSYFLIKSGVMRCVRYLEDGRRQITRFIFPGDLIVHLGNNQNMYGGEAITAVEVQFIPRDKLDQLVSKKPCLADLVTRSILEELRETQDQLLMLGQLNANERVAHFLCVLRKRLADTGHPQTEAKIPMSRADIADYLGLTIETVSRVLGRLRKEGKISLPANNILSVRDPHQLDHHLDSFVA